MMGTTLWSDISLKQTECALGIERKGGFLWTDVVSAALIPWILGGACIGALPGAVTAAHGAHVGLSVKSLRLSGEYDGTRSQM